MFLAKTNVNTIKFFISKAVIDLYINHEGFVWANNLLRECNEMKDETKIPENTVEYAI